MTRPLRARIDLQALASNLSLARDRAPGSRVLAVIKADAYGHGMVEAARALAAADALAVASLEEALRLREAAITGDIVLLEGLFEARELEAAVEQRLQLVVHSEAQLQWLEAWRGSAPLSLWLKVDTGMNRLGFAPGELHQAWERLAALPQLRKGCLRLMSHLACADEAEHPANDVQRECFEAATAGLDAERSLANSAALLTRPDMHYDWVRPGILLYGCSPLSDSGVAGVGLRPVMTLESRLIAVQQRRRGDAIGYGHSWVCPEDMPVGVVAVGYGDGYPRHAPGGTPVLVNGERVPLVGRVSMDMLCVDLRSQPQAAAGDAVVLWGEGLPVETVAAHAGTIGYELLCGVTARVPRSYAG